MKGKVTLTVTRLGETHTRVLIDPNYIAVLGWVAERVTYKVEGTVGPRVMEVLEGCYEQA
jgi:hypothetical protein